MEFMTGVMGACTAFYQQQIENDNIANQIHGFTVDYGKFILISDIPQFQLGNIRSRYVFRPIAREVFKQLS